MREPPGIKAKPDDTVEQTAAHSTLFACLTYKSTIEEDEMNPPIEQEEDQGQCSTDQWNGPPERDRRARDRRMRLVERQRQRAHQDEEAAEELLAP